MFQLNKINYLFKELLEYDHHLDGIHFHQQHSLLCM